MEKKSTKIAYCIALGVFIVLLVVLGIAYKGAPLPTFGEGEDAVTAATPFAGTFWSLLPPIVAIVLALISKEVYSSLFVGIVVGGAFACGGPIFNIYILLKLQKKEEIRATQFAIGATSASFIALQYLMSGVYQGQTLHFVFLLIPAVLLAYIVSEHIFKRINGQQFLHLVYVVLILAALMTGWQAIKLL